MTKKYLRVDRGGLGEKKVMKDGKHPKRKGGAQVDCFLANSPSRSAELNFKRGGALRPKRGRLCTERSCGNTGKTPYTE